MTSFPEEGPFVVALLAISVAALAFSFRSFHLLYRDLRPKYRGRHRTGRRSG